MINPTIRLNAYQGKPGKRPLEHPYHQPMNLSWLDFVQWIKSTHVETVDKEGQCLFNVAEFSGARAVQSDVTGAHCLVLDIDHVNPAKLAEIYGRLLPYETVWYTTHSYSEQDRRVRCVLLLDQLANPDELRATWSQVFALVPELDQKCKNLDRRYFIPSHAPGAVFWAEYSPGKPWPVSQALDVQRAPEQMQLREILAGELLAAIKREAKQGKAEACILYERARLGLPLAEQGARDNTLWRLACWFVRRWPDGEAQALVDYCGSSLDHMGEPFTRTALAEKVSRARDSERARAETGIQLLTNNQGTPVPGQENLRRILTQDQALAGRFRLNTFAERVEAADLPWEQESEGVLRDTDVTALQCYCEQKYRLTVKSTQVLAGINQVASGHKYNPVREYLESLTWDGVPRLDTWLETYAGAEHNPITSKMGARWLLSAMARVMSDAPTKVDHVLVLYGQTDLGKSSVLKALFGGDKGWFSDQLAALDTKDSAQDLPGKWCIEWAELSTFKRASCEAVKAFVTRTVDHYRPSYGRVTVDVTRHCVFCATTNEQAFLQDPTGNRRFWVVTVTGRCDLEGMARDRDQVLAEALVRYREGEQWWPTVQEQEAIRIQTDAHRVEDSWEEAVRNYYALLPADPGPQSGRWFLDKVMQLTPDRMNRAAEMRLASVLSCLGFKRVRVGDSRLRCWSPPADVLRLVGSNTMKLELVTIKS